jgi:hypothetical protein
LTHDRAPRHNGREDDLPSSARRTRALRATLVMSRELRTPPARLSCLPDERPLRQSSKEVRMSIGEAAHFGLRGALRGLPGA